MGRSIKYTNRDTLLFLEANRGTRVFGDDNRFYPTPPPARHIKNKSQATHQTSDKDLLSDLGVVPLAVESHCAHFNREVSPLLRKELQQGKLEPENILDLHNCTVERARKLLQAFIGCCQENNFFCVKVIHGKGLGTAPEAITLKSYVSHWLSQLYAVQGYCTPPARYGGAGALYVLIKNS